MARFCYEPPTESCRLVSALCRPGGCLLAAFSLPCASWTHSMHNSIHTRPARLSNLSSINHFEMEARVGIGPFTPRLRFKHTRFTSVIKHNHAYPPKLFLTLLVSVLVSVDVRTKRAKENKCSQSQYYNKSSHLRGSILDPVSHLILGRSSTGVFHPPVIVNHLSGPVEPFHVSFQFLHRD